MPRIVREDTRDRESPVQEEEGDVRVGRRRVKKERVSNVRAPP